MAQPHHNPPKQLSRLKGFTFIEMIVFIIIIGIAATATLLPLATALERTPALYYQDIALGLAQGRMEIMLGRRRLIGYDSNIDPCVSISGTVGCWQPTGYTITTTFTQTGTRTINILAKGPNSTLVRLYTTVWAY